MLGICHSEKKEYNIIKIVFQEKVISLIIKAFRLKLCAAA